MNPLIKNLKEAREKATDGPWFDSRTTKSIQVTHESPAFGRGSFNLFKYPTRTTESLVSHDEWEGNAAFVVHAANTTMDVIAYVEKLEKALKWYASKDDCWFGHCDELSQDLTDLCNDKGDVAREAIQKIEAL